MKIIRNPYVLAIGLHALAFTGLGLYVGNGSIAPTDSRTQNSSAATTPTAESAVDSAIIPKQELVHRLGESFASAAKLTANEQASAANALAQRLETISSVQSMKEMGAFLGQQMGWNPQKPSNQSADEFDHGTAMPVRVIEKPGSNGSTNLFYVMRDARNKKMEIPVPPGGELAARTLGMFDRSDVLREFKSSILLPMLESRLAK